jgi:hypothetical protein
MTDDEEHGWNYLTHHPNFVFWMGANFDPNVIKHCIICPEAIITNNSADALVWIRQNIKHAFSASGFRHFYFSDANEAVLFKLVFG